MWLDGLVVGESWNAWVGGGWSWRGWSWRDGLLDGLLDGLQRHDGTSNGTRREDAGVHGG